MFCANFSILAHDVDYTIISDTHLFHLSRQTRYFSFVLTILCTYLMNLN